MKEESLELEDDPTEPFLKFLLRASLDLMFLVKLGLSLIFVLSESSSDSDELLTN